MGIHNIVMISIFPHLFYNFNAIPIKKIPFFKNGAWFYNIYGISNTNNSYDTPEELVALPKARLFISYGN